LSILSIFLVFLIAAPASLPVDQARGSQASRSARSPLTGVYRIDIPASDKLYSVVAGASSKVPFGEQQRFFIDLAVRFTPPDLLAIEQRGNQISLGSSRAPRMTFIADGVVRNTRAADGHNVRVRFLLDKGRLIFTSSGKAEDNFSIVFEPIDGGRTLQVVRNITAEGLDQPLVIRSVYNKVADVASWELYAESPVAAAEPSDTAAAPAVPKPAPVSDHDDSAADFLRQALREWIDATNNRDIEKQMAFYEPRLKAYYLSRDTSRDFVRDEKARVFAGAGVIDIRAEEPEIIFQNAGRTAVMRYRKNYRIENGRQSRRGEVIQELRWQRGAEGWHIFSERDIRVL
jgi:ketosteroid isomerase-like protein